MRFEVVVFGQHLGSDQLLLQGLHEVQEVLRLTTTYVIYLVGRYRQAIFSVTLLRGFLHYSKHTLNNVIHVGEVAAAVAVVVNLIGYFS